jgi:hypothetical protein
VVRLVLVKCQFTNRFSWSENNQLEELEINSCACLVSIPSLDNILKVEIWGCRRLINVQGGRNHEILLLHHFLRLSNEIMQCCIFNSKNLKQLGLGTGFPEDFDDFSSFSEIPVLELLNNPLPNNNVKHFPMFLGKRIHLFNFSLSSWNGQSLPNLIKCSLI